MFRLPILYFFCMAECLIIPENGSREDIYKIIVPQIESVVGSERNIIANLANISAILKEAFGFFWVGFYMVDEAEQLVLGPFQGTLACTRIRKGKGVCGTSYAKGETILVEDVENFPSHIACSSLSRSEIVVPIFKEGRVVGVIDVDSQFLNDFSEVDRIYLEMVSNIISTFL